MSGLDRQTMVPLASEAHLAQSIQDILSTPVGSRVMRRDYGSDLPRLVDAPITPQTMIDLYAATAAALERWEPRFDLVRVQVAQASAGHVELALEGRVQDGVETRLSARVEATP